MRASRPPWTRCWTASLRLRPRSCRQAQRAAEPLHTQLGVSFGDCLCQNPQTMSCTHASVPKIQQHTICGAQQTQYRQIELLGAQAQGSEGLRAHLARVAEEALPEFKRKRPKYHYYFEWMRKRIQESCGQLPDPVMDKLLTHDATELDMLCTYPAGIQRQACPLHRCCKCRMAATWAVLSKLQLLTHSANELHSEASIVRHIQQAHLDLAACSTAASAA